MQKIILINDKQNLNALEHNQKNINELRTKIKKAKIEEQDIFINELIKLKTDYFKIKSEEGFFFLFDEFLKHSKLSLNIIFDYLYKSGNSIRINNKGIKMLINFSYELIIENKNKNSDQTFDNTINDNKSFSLEDIQSNILLLEKNDFVKKELYTDDDDDLVLGWMGEKTNNFPEANQIYYLLIEYLLKSLEDDVDPIWSWQ